MHIQNKVDKGKVSEEYKTLKNTYKSLGAEVLEIPPVKGLPDMVYAANIGFPLGNKFVVSNFRYPQRRGESEFAKSFFEKLGFKIKEIPSGISFEGQGDLLTIGGKFFLGWGKRSSKEAKNILEKELGIECIDFELKDPYFYHLDMSFAPLDSDTVLINEKSFDKEGLEKIRKCFNNVITSSEKDNKIFGCNLVVVGKNIVIGKGISQELKNRLGQYGFTVFEVPMDEFRKGGGSIKCLTLEFY